MRLRIVRRGGVLALTAVAVLLIGGAPASAAPGDGSAYGVRIDVTLLGASAANAGPLATASTPGQASASAASVAVPRILTAGVIDTTAARDPHTGAVTARASAADVAVPLLSGLGQVGASAIVARCIATQHGEQGSATLTAATLGRLGTLDASPAPNTVVPIALPEVGNVATLTLNEQFRDADGSRTVNAFHLHLLGGPGAGALGAGDVIISSATCGPRAAVAAPAPPSRRHGPVPASGHTMAAMPGTGGGPAGASGLPYTGANVTGWLAFGVLLVAAGVLAVIVGRRRQRRLIAMGDEPDALG
jgi:LPXTG-motif cell wall-anchored protein